MIDKDSVRVGSARRKFYWFILAMTGLGALFGLAFWLILGHDLHYNVYSNGEFWYREDFPFFVKIVVSILVSLIFVAIVALVVTIRHRGNGRTDGTNSFGSG